MKNKIITALMLSTVILSAGAPVVNVSADSTDAQIAQQDATIASASSAKAAAQADVDSIQSKVDSLTAEQKTNQARLDKLVKEQKATSDQIKKLSVDIAARNKNLEAQARSAQTNGGATNYINALLNSDTLTDAIQKVTAMATVASANKDMMDQQKADQDAMQAKLTANMKAYAEATELEKSLADQAKEMTTQQAQLKVAQISYDLTIATAQDQKSNLQAQKVAAEQAAAAAAAAQKAEANKQAQLEQQAQQVTQNNNVNSGSSSNQTNSTASTPTPAPSDNGGGGSTPAPQPTPTPQPTPAPSAPSHSGSNPYPAGQCTAFVWNYFSGKIPTYAGNAGDWVAYANSGPAVGTIAVFPPGVQGAGGVGHVAVVTAVNGGQITIVEGNYAGLAYNTRTISTAGVSFIRP